MATVTKKNLIEKISAETNIQKPDVRRIVEGFLKDVKLEMQMGNRIEIRDFGVFETKIRKSRIGRNPKKPQDVVTIPARKVVNFKVGREFKNMVERNLPEQQISE